MTRSGLSVIQSAASSKAVASSPWSLVPWHLQYLLIPRLSGQILHAHRLAQRPHLAEAQRDTNSILNEVHPSTRQLQNVETQPQEGSKNISKKRCVQTDCSQNRLASKRLLLGYGSRLGRVVQHRVAPAGR